MKQTSIKSYHEELESGHITKRQQQVMDILKYNDVATAKQLSEKVPGAWKRLSELVGMGVVRICGLAQDMQTNKTINVYTLTGAKPLHKKPCVKKAIRKIDPKALAHIYNKAVAVGTRMAIEKIKSLGHCLEYTTDHLIDIVLEVQE